mgnify:CR=1 FL=1
MKEMACEERPYERCEQFGASNLTDSELLAVLLRTGTRGENALQLADKILHPVFSQKGVLNLHQWTYEQLMQIKGIKEGLYNKIKDNITVFNLFDYSNSYFTYSLC